jgi:hypothetical protein
MYCIPAVLPLECYVRWGKKLKERKGKGEKYRVKWKWNKRPRKE